MNNIISLRIRLFLHQKRGILKIRINHTSFHWIIIDLINYKLCFLIRRCFISLLCVCVCVLYPHYHLIFEIVVFAEVLNLRLNLTTFSSMLTENYWNLNFFWCLSNIFLIKTIIYLKLRDQCFYYFGLWVINRN